MTDLQKLAHLAERMSEMEDVRWVFELEHDCRLHCNSLWSESVEEAEGNEYAVVEIVQGNRWVFELEHDCRLHCNSLWCESLEEAEGIEYATQAICRDLAIDWLVEVVQGNLGNGDPWLAVVVHIPDELLLEWGELTTSEINDLLLEGQPCLSL